MRVPTPGIRSVRPTASFNDRSRVGIVLKMLKPDDPDGIAMYAGNLVDVLMLDTLTILYDVIVANSSGDVSCPDAMFDKDPEDYNAVMGAIEGTADLPDLNGLAGDRVIVEFMNGGVPYVCNVLTEARPNATKVPRPSEATGTTPADPPVTHTLVRKIAKAAVPTGGESGMFANDADDIENYVGSKADMQNRDRRPPPSGLEIKRGDWDALFDEGWDAGLTAAWDQATSDATVTVMTVDQYQTDQIDIFDNDATRPEVAARVAGYKAGIARAATALALRRTLRPLFPEQLTSKVAYVYSRQLAAGAISPDDNDVRAARDRAKNLVAEQGGRPTRGALGAAFSYLTPGKSLGSPRFTPNPPDWTKNLEPISFLYKIFGEDAQVVVNTTVHKRVAPMVICAFADIERAQSVHEKWVPQTNIEGNASLGGFDSRYARYWNNGVAYKIPGWSTAVPGGVLSAAAYGAAIFIDSDVNGFGAPPHTTIPMWVVDIFESWGFTWGGRWGGKQCDPRLFEWTRPEPAPTEACLKDGDD